MCEPICDAVASFVDISDVSNLFQHSIAISKNLQRSETPVKRRPESNLYTFYRNRYDNSYCRVALLT